MHLIKSNIQALEENKVWDFMLILTTSVIDTNLMCILTDKPDGMASFLFMNGFRKIIFNHNDANQVYT